MSKRIRIILLAVLALLGFAACGDSSSDNGLVKVPSVEHKTLQSAIDLLEDKEFRVAYEDSNGTPLVEPYRFADLRGIRPESGTRVEPRSVVTVIVGRHPMNKQSPKPTPSPSSSPSPTVEESPAASAVDLGQLVWDEIQTASAGNLPSWALPITQIEGMNSSTIRVYYQEPNMTQADADLVGRRIFTFTMTNKEIVDNLTTVVVRDANGIDKNVFKSKLGL